MEDIYYKWLQDDYICCARVINNTTADYYRDGELYASMQQFIKKDTDIEITESEFNTIVNSI